MTVKLQVNASAAKGDAFHFEQQALLERVLAGDSDCAASPDDSMPRQPPERTERPNYLSRRARKSGSGSHFAIGGHFPRRDLPNHVRKNN
jgi:hypothetical protein